MTISQYLCNQKYTSLPPYSPTWHSVPTTPGQPPPSEPGPLNTIREVSARMSTPPTPECPTDHDFRTASIEREQLARQFERLIAGQETETGEPPPSYKVVESPVHSHTLHV
jgi:hypothetical protein